MTVETALYPPSLNTAWPYPADFIAEGDDHIRLTKLVVKTTLPNITGAVTASHTELNYVTGVTSAIQTQFTAKATKAGDTYTGAHNFTGATLTTATPAVGNSTTLAATTAYVQGEFAAKFTGLSGVVTATTAELNYSVGVTSSIQTQINAKASKTGDTYTGTQDFTGATTTVATQTLGDNSTLAASTAFVNITAMNAGLPTTLADAGKFAQSDGTTVAFQAPELPIELVSTSQTATKGYHSVITDGGVTLTVPALAAGEAIAFSNASGATTAIVDFGAAKVLAQTVGAMTLDTLTAAKTIVGTGNATYGYAAL
jgi:hypothetical protein